MLKTSFGIPINGDWSIVYLEEMLSLFNVYYVINQEDYFWILDPIPEKTNPKCPIFKVYEYGIFFIFNKDGFTHFNELNSLVQTGNDNKTLVKKIGLEELPTDVKNILLDTIPQYLQINYN